MLICFVSLKGVRLQSSFPVDSGEVLNITRALGDNLIIFKGNPIYVTSSEGQGFELGISVQDIENQDSIAVAQAGAFWARFSILPGRRFQYELQTLPLCPNLSISGRNMHQIWADGKSIVQLAKDAPLGPVCVIRGRNCISRCIRAEWRVTLGI